MTGLRKTGLINALRNYNEQFNLGLDTKEIAELSTGQLKKIVTKVRDEQGLSRKTTSRYGD